MKATSHYPIAGGHDRRVVGHAGQHGEYTQHHEGYAEDNNAGYSYASDGSRMGEIRLRVGCGELCHSVRR
jgi:hypothetical protein